MPGHVTLVVTAFANGTTGGYGLVALSALAAGFVINDRLNSSTVRGGVPTVPNVGSVTTTPTHTPRGPYKSGAAGGRVPPRG